MIYTVTANPAIDEVLAIEELMVGGVSRVQATVRQAGGKGINVSRALHTLGTASQTLALIGEESAVFFEQALAREGLSLVPFLQPGSNRVSRTLVFRTNVFNTHLREDGPVGSPEAADALFAWLDARLAQGDYLVLSGSLPPGVPDGFYSRLIALATSRDALAFLDTSGEALTEGIGAVPFCLKVNLDEFIEFSQQSEEDRADFKQRLLELHQGGISLVVITMGSEGAVLFDGEQYFHARSPEGETAADAQRYAVGSGDAFLAGLLVALGESRPIEDCLAWGVACGAANALLPGSAFFQREDADAAYGGIIRRREPLAGC
jgi:1-phosphofructokinase family hexose kinase